MKTDVVHVFGELELLWELRAPQVTNSSNQGHNDHGLLAGSIWIRGPEVNH